jgi:hypothetical protein
LFGYRLEPDFDVAKERRRDRLKVALIGGFVLCVLYLFSGEPYATEAFQGCVATGLFYGEDFYVQRKDDLGKLWLWKAIFATVPLHALYLAGWFWSDRAFPNLMTKGTVFIPLLFVGFALESTLFGRIVDRFKPSIADKAGGPVAQT